MIAKADGPGHDGPSGLRNRRPAVIRHQSSTAVEGNADQVRAWHGDLGDDIGIHNISAYTLGLIGYRSPSTATASQGSAILVAICCAQASDDSVGLFGREGVGLCFGRAEPCVGVRMV